jgi:molybdate transport system substrate-binding protein
MNKKKKWWIRTGVVFFVSLCFFQGAAVADELHLFAGAGLRQPVDRIVKNFEETTGHRVFTDYAGGGKLLARIEASKKGDLYIPGAFFYIEKLEKAGRIRSFRPIAQHTPVIGVNRDRGETVKEFDDLSRPGVRLAMGDPKAMAFGRTAMAILERSDQKEAILKNVVVYGATVKQLALYVSQGSVDAAIIGRADAFQNQDRIRMVPIPEAYFHAEVIAGAILDSTVTPELSEQLLQFLSSEEAVGVFQECGFLPIEK